MSRLPVTLVAALLLVTTGFARAAELTPTRYIYEIFVDDDSHYFRAGAVPSATTAVGWGAAGCPNAAYAYTRQLAAQKDILAVALTAAAMGKAVVFKGTCDPDLNYFRVTSIVVKP
jgi:hypothetical protein